MPFTFMGLQIFTQAELAAKDKQLETLRRIELYHQQAATASVLALWMSTLRNQNQEQITVQMELIELQASCFNLKIFGYIGQIISPLTINILNEFPTIICDSSGNIENPLLKLGESVVVIQPGIYVEETWKTIKPLILYCEP